jgi:cell division protease FtsH
MSERLGLAILERDQAPILGTGASMRNYDYSEATARLIDSEINRLLNGALSGAIQLVNRYRAVIEEGAQVLLAQETLDEQELKSIWEKRESPIKSVGAAG